MKIARNLLLLILITLLLIFVLEITTRLILGSPPDDRDPVMTDPVLNHKWKPNNKYEVDSRGIRYTLNTNNQSWVGQKNIPLKKDKNTIRIFYLGDSNVQGVVNEEDTMVALVRKELNSKLKKTGKKIEVINTGTSSYSPSIYYLLVKNQIIKYSPDIVVINVDMTDVRDDALYKTLTTFDNKNLPLSIRPSNLKNKEEYILAPKGVVLISTPEKFIKSLRRNSSLFYNFEKLYLSFSKIPFLRKTFSRPLTPFIPPIDNTSWLSFDPSLVAQKNTKYSMFILSNTIDLLKRKGIKVVITSVPHHPQYSGTWSARPHEIVEKTAKENDVAYLNTYLALKHKISNSAQNKYYWDSDPTHFNEEGNKIWSDVQIKFLTNFIENNFYH